MMSISIDPDTGMKIFNTRAASMMDDVVGRGYSVTADEALKTLPTQPPGAVFVMNRDEFLAMGGLDEELFLFFNDVDICWRLQAKKLEIDPTIIASRSTMVRLACGAEGVFWDVLPWQQELLGIS